MMRRFGAFTLVWLSVSSAANCWQLSPEGGVVSQHDPELRIELSPSMIEDMGGFNFVQAALANATLPGKPRTPRHNQFNGLEARQNNETCTNPGYIIVCPITDPDPCCAPNYPICCQTPSTYCCPTGTFCQGAQTCCLSGSTGCGQGCCLAGIVCCNNVCCPSSSYTCDTSTSLGTCVTTSSTASQSQSQSQATASHETGAVQTGTSNKSNNTAIIGGAAGGGAVALIAIAGLAWWILRRKPNQSTTTNANANTNGAATGSGVPPNNYSIAGTSGVPLMAGTPSAYNSGGTPISFAQHTQANTNSPPPGGVTMGPGGQPYGVSNFVTSPGGAGGMGHVGGAAAGMGAGLVAGGLAAEAMRDQNNPGHGGLNYVPPPAENNAVGANYYANTPIPNLGGGYGGSGQTGNYGGYDANQSNYAPSTTMSPTSAHMSMTSAAPLVPMSAVGYNQDERPPWHTGGSPSHSPSPSHGANASSYTPAPSNSYTPPPASTYSPPPPGASPGPGPGPRPGSGTPQYNPVPHQGQTSFGSDPSTHAGMLSPPPGVMSPPPPFTPAPGGAGSSSNNSPGYAPWAVPADAGGGSGGNVGGAGGSDGMGRTVPMTAPGDSKATYRGAGGSN